MPADPISDRMTAGAGSGSMKSKVRISWVTESVMIDATPFSAWMKRATSAGSSVRMVYSTRVSADPSARTTVSPTASEVATGDPRIAGILATVDEISGNGLAIERVDLKATEQAGAYDADDGKGSGGGGEL